MERDDEHQIVVVPPLIRREITAIQPEEGNYIHGYMVNARGTEERIGKSGQKFVEVDDDFRPCLLNPLIYIVWMLRFFTRMTALRSSKKLALSFREMERDDEHQIVVVPPMSNTNIRNRGTEERIGKSGQKFVEVDDDFRPCLQV